MIKIEIDHLIFDCRVSGHEEDELVMRAIWDAHSTEEVEDYLSILRGNKAIIGNIFPNIGLINYTYEDYPIYPVFHNCKI